ncbi:MAG: Holliday junction branch migration protein RuvA [Brachybacterium sp.]|nr:Holliday junction branch migration protein RuvA [Brachybacterium sp.]
MIATLTGRVAALDLNTLVLDVHGVGYLVHMTPQALSSIRHEQELRVHTELVVREDSLTLFGFSSAEEAEVFRIIQSVSGIGPRIALAALAVLTPEELRRAVAAEDAKAIARTPGIGPKVANRMILELQGKLGAPSRIDPALGQDADTPDATPETPDQEHADVVAALVGLGWPEKAAGAAVRDVADEGRSDPATLLRGALRALGASR